MASLKEWFRGVAEELVEPDLAARIAAFIAGRCADEDIDDSSDVGMFVDSYDEPKPELIAKLLGTELPPRSFDVFVLAAIRGRRKVNSMTFTAVREHTRTAAADMEATHRAKRLAMAIPSRTLSESAVKKLEKVSASVGAGIKTSRTLSRPQKELEQAKHKRTLTCLL